MEMAKPLVKASGLLWTLLCIACVNANAGEVVVGQSLSLTGGGAEVAKQFMEGAACRLQEINQGGGIRGNTLRLVSLDDGGNKDKTLENAKRLVEKDKAQVLFGFTSAAGAQATFPLLDETGTPLVAVASGGLGIRDKFRRNVFHVRASYVNEIEGAIDLARMAGMLSGAGTFGFVYNQDAKANLTAYEEVVKQRKVVSAVSVGIDRNSKDMKAPAELILKAKPTVLFAITTAPAMGALIKSLRAIGYSGTIISSSFAGDPLVKEAGPEGAGVIVAHAVPETGMASSGIAVAYERALLRCAKQSKPSASGLEGYISARVLEEGIRKAGAAVTRESITTGLEAIRNLDLGGIKIAYSPTDHDGTDFVEYLIITKSGRLKK